MHAKYDVSLSYGSKVMAYGKVFPSIYREPQRDQRLRVDAPRFHFRGKIAHASSTLKITSILVFSQKHEKAIIDR